MNEYYVYVLMDSSKPGSYNYGSYTFEYEPFYIGKGIGDRIKNTLYDKSPFKYNKIQKLRRLNIEIISEKVIENLNIEESLELEKELIRLIGRRDLNEGVLINGTDGGDGRLNSKHSEETKKKISENRKGKGIGWKHTDETLKIISDKQSGVNNGFFGKKHNEETKDKHSIMISGINHPMYNKTHSENTKSLLREKRKNVSDDKIKESCQKFNKTVLMYDLQMNFIQEFNSIKEASEKTNINRSLISKCCRGVIKKPTRYFFKFKHDKDMIKNNRYLIKIGDSFEIDGKIYKLFKRNNTSAICEYNGQMITLRYIDYDILKRKDGE